MLYTRRQNSISELKYCRRTRYLKRRIASTKKGARRFSTAKIHPLTFIDAGNVQISAAEVFVSLFVVVAMLKASSSAGLLVGPADAGMSSSFNSLAMASQAPNVSTVLDLVVHTNVKYR